MKGRPEPPRTARGGAFSQHLILLAVCAAAVIALHAPFLSLPYFWDEAGYYIPAARDLLLTGDPIPRSTATNPHPPLLSYYLAAAWKVGGESPLVTRLAMSLVAGAALYALLLLARPLVPVPAGLWAAGLTIASPVFFSQSIMAHLDMAAALGTLLALHFFFGHRLVAGTVTLAALCLARETGAVLVMVLAAAEWRRSRSFARAALWLWPLVPLAAWFVALRWRTGLWLGDREFAAYNVWGTLHPARVAVQMAKRAFQLGISDFHWVALLLILAAWWKGAFSMSLERRQLIACFIAAQTAFMSVFGGATLARYLLPAYPLFLLLAADAGYGLFRASGRRWQGAGAALGMLLPVAFALSWLQMPPYPRAYEDTVAWTEFTRLHRDSARMLENLTPGTRILTAWPASDELVRPWLGYVQRSLPVVAVGTFTERDLAPVAPGSFDALVSFSRHPNPGWYARHPWLASLETRYFGALPPLSSAQIAERFGLRLRMRNELGGQWLELWTRPGVELESSPRLQAQAVTSFSAGAPRPSRR